MGRGDHEGRLWPAGAILGREAGSPLCSQRAWMEAEGPGPLSPCVAGRVGSPWAPGRLCPLTGRAGIWRWAKHPSLLPSSQDSPEQGRASAQSSSSWDSWPSRQGQPRRPVAHPGRPLLLQLAAGRKLRGGQGRSTEGGSGWGAAVLQIPPLTRAGIAPSAPPRPGPCQATGPSRLLMASLSDLTPCCPSPLQPGILVTM